MKRWTLAVTMGLLVAVVMGALYAAEGKAKAEGKTKKVRKLRAQGEVTAVTQATDEALGTLSVAVKKEREEGGTLEFTVAADAKIRKANKEATLTDVAVGQKVIVTYTKGDDTLTATQIRIIPAREGKQGDGKKKSNKKGD